MTTSASTNHPFVVKRTTERDKPLPGERSFATENVEDVVTRILGYRLVPKKNDKPGWAD